MARSEVWAQRELLMSPVYIGFCLGPDRFEAEIKRLGLSPRELTTMRPRSDAATYCLERKDGKSLCLVYMPTDEWGDGIQVASLLVHEAVHIWQVICSEIGEDDPSKEFEAYSIQAISQELMRLYVSQKKNLPSRDRGATIATAG